jgi:hypothetical protein
MAYNRPTSFIPEVWSGTILSRLNDALVFGQVVNRDYEGEIRGYGDVVKINEIGPITINTYNATSTSALTVQSISDAQKLLQINKAESFTFWIDDIDMVQTKPKLMTEAMKESAFAAANSIDEYVAALHSEAGLKPSGTPAAGTNTTSTNVLKALAAAAQSLDENNVPQQGRWMVVPPWFAHKMVLARIVQDTSNSSFLSSGLLGRSIYGFDIYVSNNAAAVADGTAVMFGYRGSISLAVQVTKVETARPSLIGFKTLVKGLYVYGAKVVRPNTLGALYLDETAEAT